MHDATLTMRTGSFGWQAKVYGGHYIENLSGRHGSSFPQWERDTIDALQQRIASLVARHEQALPLASNGHRMSHAHLKCSAALPSEVAPSVPTRGRSTVRGKA